MIFSYESVLFALDVAHLTFCFLDDCPKQNAGSLLTPFSDTVFDTLSHGTLGFALHGSYLNHFLQGENSSTTS